MQTLEDLGWTPFFDRQLSDDERRLKTPARVTWEGRERYRVSTGNAEWLGEPAGRFRHEVTSAAAFPAIGDWVVITTRPETMGATIHRCLERRSRFSRAAAGRSATEQVVAANVDTVLLVTSFNHDFNLRRLERYLSLVWENGANPVIVLNKSDLLQEHDAFRAEANSIAPGIPIHVVSATLGDGIEELRARICHGGTTALLGSSGVGKSSLVNSIVGQACQAVLPTRAHDDRGRHGTTAGQLFCVPGGGVLIDTPGMRELQLWDAGAGMEHTFDDITALSQACRFRDCSHESEPGCAVLDAIARGHLARERLASFHRLQRENAFLLARHDEAVRAERTRKAKHIAKAVRLQNRLRNR